MTVKDSTFFVSLFLPQRAWFLPGWFPLAPKRGIVFQRLCKCLFCSNNNTADGSAVYRQLGVGHVQQRRVSALAFLVSKFVMALEWRL
ncbi:hypothetical protein B0H17DRAFT_1077068 [Mycena rosella]|uniref:Uncharacterized protein n=1 Tax=Mycena rosella TaxID=1033263 RepID=A0AAD7GDA4_MYCRO|nr:hypothetical protein B0H17DRAFT_1077068 [Mycena rosella]